MSCRNLARRQAPVDNRLRDKVAVIGDGNGGICLAAAREFKARRAKIVIFGRNSQTLDQAAALLGDDSPGSG